MTAQPIHIPSLRVLGVRVHMVQLPDALAILERWTQDRDKCRYVVVTGMHGVMEAQKDPGFKAIVNEADLFVPDGISLVWAARLRGRWLKRRVPGSDLMWEYLKLSAQKGYRNFFYGDTPETLDRLVRRLQDQLPRLNICGVHSPPFRPPTAEERARDAKMINDSQADVVWVGLGLPKQERWMVENREDLNAAAVIGVGAAFKFLSGQVSRAPKWVGDNGFEWMWRLLHEPRLVWRRVLVDGPRFVCQLGLEFSRLKKFD